MTFRTLVRVALPGLLLQFPGCSTPVQVVCPALPTQIFHGGSVAGALTVDTNARVELMGRPNTCIDPDARVEWTTSAPRVIAIEAVRDTTVVVRALAPGEAVITARQLGSSEVGAQVRFRVRAGSGGG